MDCSELCWVQLQPLPRSSMVDVLEDKSSSDIDEAVLECRQQTVRLLLLQNYLEHVRNANLAADWSSLNLNLDVRTCN